MLVWQNVYLSKCIIADRAVQCIRKVVIQYIRVRIKIKSKHACIFMKLQNRNLMVHRANQRLYWMIHLTFGHHYWMILQKNLGMTPPYYSGRGRYTKGFNDFRMGTLNQHSFLLYVYHVSTIIIVIIILIIIIMIRIFFLIIKL